MNVLWTAPPWRTSSVGLVHYRQMTFEGPKPEWRPLWEPWMSGSCQVDWRWRLVSAFVALSRSSDLTSSRLLPAPDTFRPHCRMDYGFNPFLVEDALRDLSICR